MPLTVETGAGLANAQAYASVAAADAYCSARGLTAWTALQTAAKEANLILAAEFIDTAYSRPGVRKSKAQALAWPCEYPDPDGDLQIGLPAQVVNANILLAVEAISGSLAPTSTGPAVKRLKTRVEGVVEKETEYVSGGQLEVRTFPAVDRLLTQVGARPLSGQNAGSGIKVVRR